ncbi:MAG TPA: RT0821/Lpp0805 family surface protein [Gammaproteobacteria bacterium]|nr:RT0821/Lpp0805 family surface protein [Gammaproteobacteria bacterium]
MSTAKRTVQLVAVSLGLLCGVAAIADPPAHAPAHGWRKKHDPYYVGRTGVSWEHDYEISAGRCNREAIATVVGGVVGGAIANRVAEEDRVVATIIGAAAGALIGKKIGGELDERDRDCIGHALDIGQRGRTVVWTNETSGVRYELAPGADSSRNGAPCRAFTLAASRGGEKSSQSGLACQSQPGVWQTVK